MTPRDPSVIPRESATGAIYDLGYRGYDGVRLGRRHALSTLFWASLRAAFGLKRSGRAKIVPWGITALLVAPAAVTVAVAALAPGAPSQFSYDDYLWNTQVLFAIFVAAQAPELVSSDQRNRVLSLYFSHALQRADYALAKLGALAAAVFGLALIPMLVLFIGRVLLAADVPAAFGDEIGDVPQVIGAPLVYAVPLSALAMAISAYTPRRAYATGSIIALFIVTAAVSAILGEAITSGPLRQYGQLINPFVALDGTRDWLLGDSIDESPVQSLDLPMPLYGGLWLAITIASAAVTWWRYRRVAA
jgi:ABC-2 type transport system permease protein